MNKRVHRPKEGFIILDELLISNEFFIDNGLNELNVVPANDIVLLNFNAFYNLSLRIDVEFLLFLLKTLGFFFKYTIK